MTVTNQEHLQRVSELAARFGAEIGRPEAAALAGQFHDFGKYSDRFAGVLRGVNQNVDHALPGAAFLYYAKNLGQKPNLCEKYTPILECIAGHHDGLRAFGELKDYFKLSMQSDEPQTDLYGKTMSLCGSAEYMNARAAFLKDFPMYRFPKLPVFAAGSIIESMLDTRMLFSCLVDADHSISASDDDPSYLENSAGGTLNADAALENLYAYYAKLKESSTANSELNILRNEVFESCGAAGELPPGLFTLTAPTGVGKTLAMLHFALKHCRKNNLKRVFAVLPFLTLAEQSEHTYEKILPEILVDHSQKNLPETARDLAARWDAPFIITTSVRFFESLFADRSTDCRKLHSIANSVVLFDEAQSLPTDLAPATLKAVNALCEKYNCTMVFSTATQPDFDKLSDLTWKPREILPENHALYEKMRRTKTEWRLYKNDRLTQNPTMEEIAAEAAELNSVCVIVNLRRHARALFEAMQQLCEADSVFLLTTDLCPAHRLAMVEEIKMRLKAGLPCRVAATQCIEAGVDLDFDTVYRSLAPLESIVQAAGRCNRNGKLPNGGRVVVFEPQTDSKRMYPGDFYAKCADTVKQLWAENGTLDIHDPYVMTEYNRLIFAGNVEKPALTAALKEKSYLKTAKEYKLISNEGVQVIVPWEGARELFDEIENTVLTVGLTASILRKAAPITVSCFEREWVEQHATPLRRAGDRTRAETGYYILNRGHENCYDTASGLQTGRNFDENYFV